jgi:hypothetical protein
MAYERRKFSHTENTRTAYSRNTTAYPGLLFLRKMIDDAFHIARGRHMEAAAEARKWINEPTDWTLHKELTPDHAKYYGSFEWCCHWFGENPDQVRAEGLSPAHRVGSSQGAETWAKNKP